MNMSQIASQWNVTHAETATAPARTPLTHATSARPSTTTTQARHVRPRRTTHNQYNLSDVIHDKSVGPPQRVVKQTRPRQTSKIKQAATRAARPRFRYNNLDRPAGGSSDVTLDYDGNASRSTGRSSPFQLARCVRGFEGHSREMAIEIKDEDSDGDTEVEFLFARKVIECRLQRE